jgi:hypothetical protein
MTSLFERLSLIPAFAGLRRDKLVIADSLMNRMPLPFEKFSLTPALSRKERGIAVRSFDTADDYCGSVGSGAKRRERQAGFRYSI